MSMTSVAQVRSSSKSRGSARTLLLVIASHTNPDTGWAWPSLNTLAREVALTRRRIRQLVHQLEGLGELEVRRGQGRGHVNFYRVHLASAEKGKSPPRKGEISDPEKGKCLSPKSKREREKKGAPAAPVFSLSPDKPEQHGPFWCDAHGFCHSERLPDRRPDCAQERELPPRSGDSTMTERYHCDACGWDGEDPMLSELQGEGCGGVLWTLRVCPECGAEVYATVIPQPPQEPWGDR
jgi:helix-turn-helix protein